MNSQSDAASTVPEVLASFARLCERPEFLDSFYQRFMECSPEVTAFFAQVDMDHHTVMLRGSLELMLGAAGQQDPAAVLAPLARFHGRGGRGIPAHLYDHWLESLLEAVETMDSEADEELIDAWRRALEPGVRFMQSHAPGVQEKA